MGTLVKPINKVANFTDIHWGDQGNSGRHNQDCLDFVEWFCKQAKEQGAQGILFLGDWFEQRHAINGLTLDYAYRGAKLLNDSGLPVWIIVGNHDLYYRHNRSIYHVNVFESFKNITIVNEPLEVKELGPKGSLICPWLFHHEFPTLLNYNHLPVWFGHLEFKGFVITGETITLDHGPDVDDYTKPVKIFTGHFHKRQCDVNNRVHYIGNPFATKFSDCNDFNRGMMIYTFDKDKVEYINYDGPTFIKTKLSALLDDLSILKPNATVKCLVDDDLTLDESNKMREQFMKKYSLRDFQWEEQSNKDALQNTDMDLTGLEMENTDTVVCNLLGRVEKEGNINPDELIRIYKSL